MGYSGDGDYTISSDGDAIVGDEIYFRRTVFVFRGEHTHPPQKQKRDKTGQSPRQTPINRDKTGSLRDEYETISPKLRCCKLNFGGSHNLGFGLKEALST